MSFFIKQQSTTQIDRLETRIDTLENNIDKLKSQIDRLETQIDRLETRIDTVVNLLKKVLDQNITDSKEINKNLNSINNCTKNMDNHINFVENVFDVVKHPFSSLLSLYYGKDKASQIHNDILDIHYSSRKKLDLN
jgi:chromosome segregation ATPase